MEKFLLIHEIALAGRPVKTEISMVCTDRDEARFALNATLRAQASKGGKYRFVVAKSPDEFFIISPKGVELWRVKAARRVISEDVLALVTF